MCQPLSQQARSVDVDRLQNISSARLLVELLGNACTVIEALSLSLSFSSENTVDVLCPQCVLGFDLFFVLTQQAVSLTTRSLSTLQSS